MGVLSPYRRTEVNEVLQKAVQPFLQTDEAILVGTIAVPKGGLLKAGMSAGIGPLATSAGAVAGALGSAAAGAAAARSDQAQSAVKLPPALRMALTDHNRLMVVGHKRLVLAVPGSNHNHANQAT